MRIIVHKGTDEIGGSCIELEHDGFAILLDLGRPIEQSSKPVEVASIKADAVLVSHPHQDHYGLVEGLDKSIPVYISELSKLLIDAARLFSRQPLLENEFHFFKTGEAFEIGPFTIMPYLMDHSSPDAFAFLVEADNVRVLYSGDFRAHGRKTSCFEGFVQNPPSDIDLLLMEGTMLERSGVDDFPDEQAVEEKIVEVLASQRNTSFLICSSQNIDRLVSAFRACKRTRRILVVDLYTAWVLEQMKLVSERVPNMFWDDVRVYIPNNQYQVVHDNPEIFKEFTSAAFKAEQRVKIEELVGSPETFLQVVRLSGTRTIKRYLGKEPVNIIYSQWSGYIDDDEHATYGADELNELRNDPRVNFLYAHTSGHAFLDDLKRFAKAVNPKALVPIHTEHKEGFKEHFDNVMVLEDEQEVIIGNE